MKKTILTLSAFALVGATASADWNLITDFDGAGAKPLIDDWRSSFTIGGTVAENTILYSADPVDASNSVLLMQPGQSGNTSHVLRLDEADQLVSSFAGENKGTVFFRFLMPIIETDLGPVTGDLDLTMGMISTSEEVGADGAWQGITGGDSAPSWGNYASIVRSLDGDIDVRDHGVLSSYLKSEEIQLETGNVWYNFWIVHDFITQDYKVYVQGGEAAEITLFTTSYEVPTLDGDGNPVLDDAGNPTTTTAFEDGAANFRAKSNPLGAFMLRYSSNVDGTKGIHPGYIDDLYIDVAGENLTSPVGDPVVPVVEGDLINIATRGNVGEGVDAMIAGFVVEGGTKNVLVQAVGPELIDGTVLTDANVLADPVLVIVPAATAADASTHITVDDWSGDAVVNAGLDAGATTLTAGSTSAATVVELPAGAYTVIVGGGTGVALVEVYDLD